MVNLKLIQCQPRWRVAVVAWFARVVGVMIHVEGLPLGSSRNYRPLGIDHSPNPFWRNPS